MYFVYAIYWERLVCDCQWFPYLLLQPSDPKRFHGIGLLEPGTVVIGYGVFIQLLRYKHHYFSYE